MKHFLFSAAGLLLFSVAALATEKNDTTIIYKEKVVTIKDSEEETSVSIRKTDGQNSYKMYYEARYSDDGKKKGTWHLNSTFDFPFSDLILKKDKNRKSKISHKFDPHWSGLGFGFCNAVQTATGGFNGPVGVNADFARSYEIFWNIFSIHIPINRRNWGLVSGLGLNWRNYKMNNQYRFIKEGTDLRIGEYPEGASIDYSRLKTFDITIPLLLEWQSPKTRGRFFISLGPVVGFKTYSSVKTKYSLNGTDCKEFHKGIHQNPVNVDILAQIGYRHIGLYVKYSLFPVLQTRYSPDLHSLSTGITLLL